MGAAMKLHSLPSSVFCNKQGLGIGLWSVWLCGFLLIAFSFYATQMLLPSALKNQIQNPKLFDSGFNDLASPKITLFTAPMPFTGSIGAKQALAIRSWLGLSPDITVILFSADQSVFSFVDDFGSRVSVEPNIDFTFLGTPFFHSMVARSLASTSDISVIIDPQTILFPDFISTLNYAHKLDHDWILMASSRNVSDFPFLLDDDGKHWLTSNGKRVKPEKLQALLAHNWKLKQCEERVLMAWNNGDLPLHNGVLPPFLYGKGLHNHWVFTEALSSDFRVVLDASGTISNFFLNDLNHVPYLDIEETRLSNIENRSWENEVNSQLGALYGSLYFREASYSNLFKFLKCGGSYFLVNAAQNFVYSLGYHRKFILRKEKIYGSIRKKILDCVNASKLEGGVRDCSMKDHFESSSPLKLPFSLDLLLSLRVDENKTIVLAIAGYSYKDMLMSWICRLRRLNISNFLVCALDNEIYDFAIFQGLPVFKDTFAPTNISFDECHFGTKCFQRVTKVKSRVVLQILKMGYNVLMSDVDVFWFKNPLAFLNSFGPATLVAQSDEYNLTGPINLPRRLNSGFYYAHSDASTIAAFEKIVKHAAISNLSEQPSFYDTLCGEGGSNRVDNNKCLEPESNLTVHFLDRDLFPNGAYKGLWETQNVREICVSKGCYVLHNNWISGRRKKLERQVFSGLWEYDMSLRMCFQSWHKNIISSYF